MNYSKKGISAKQKKLNSMSGRIGNKFGLTFMKVFLILILVGGVTIGCAGFGVIKGLIDNAPDISGLDLKPTGYATKFYDSAGNETATIVMTGSNRVYATIDEMPQHLLYAFIDIEDERFLDHHGIDIKGIFRAAYKGLTTGDFSEGASTITQQLLKNKLFNSGMGEDNFMDSVKRKIQEQYLALELEKTHTKEEILESYLNMINLGSNTLGVQAAAKRYFNKDVWDLTISESSVIAAITQNPSARNPILYPEKNNERRILVLKKMLEFGHITQAEYDEAMADDVYSRIQDTNVAYENDSSTYSYFSDALINQLLEDFQKRLGYDATQASYLLYSGGLSVYSTQDASIQAICDEEYANEDNFPDGTQYSISWAWSIQHEDGTKENFSERSLEQYFKNGDEANGVSANRFFKLIFDSKEDADAAIATFKQNKLLETDTVLGENLIYTLQPQSSFVIMDQSTGYVKALVGGRGAKEVNRSLNRATDTARQPGSTFKIVSTYAAALDTAGFTLASVQYDEEGFTAPDGTPFANYNKVYKGYTTIREAIRDSVNIVAVKTMIDITPSLGFSYLQNFGFSTLVDERIYNDGTRLTDIGYALSLGGITDGVTNLDLTASYAAIANGGTYVEPVLYTRVVDHNGKVILENVPERHQVIKDTTAYLLTSAMIDVITSGTGSRARIPNMTTAGKTGSTSDYNDVWFVGYTPYYTAGIWSGYDENKSQTGSMRNYHRNLWAAIMIRVHENLENKDFPRPNGITSAAICRKSGKVAIPGVCDSDPRGSMVRTEYFASGTVPTEVCDHHIKVTICKDSGAIASEFCPPESLEERVFISNPNMSLDPNAVVTEKPLGNSDDLQYMIPSGFTDTVCPIHAGLDPNDPNAPVDPNAPIDPNAPVDPNVPTAPVETTPAAPEGPPSGTVVTDPSSSVTPTIPTQPTEPQTTTVLPGPWQ